MTKYYFREVKMIYKVVIFMGLPNDGDWMVLVVEIFEYFGVEVDV